MDNTSNGEGLNLDHSPAPKNKQYSNKLIIMVVVFIVAVALSFWAGYSFSNQKRTNSDSDSQAKLLFVMKGDVLVKENQLTIVDEEIEWFTDRPNRDAGRMTTQNFMNLWRESGFNSVPPNAAFSNLSAVVELSNPSLDGDSITFDFVVTSGELRDGLLENTSLFVDTIPTPVNGQITDAVTQASANDGLC